MANVEEALQDAKKELVKDGLDLLVFMHKALSEVKPDKKSEAYADKIAPSEHIALAMDAYISNLKCLNARGYEFILASPMEQNIEGPLCTSVVFESFCTGFQGAHYQAFEEKCNKLDASQKALADLYEENGKQHAFKKSVSEGIAITLMVIITVAYYVLLGPLAGGIAAAVFALGTAIAGFSWAALSHQKKFEWMHDTLEEATLEDAFAKNCEPHRFFKFKKEEPKNSEVPTEVSEATLSQESLSV